MLLTQTVGRRGTLQFHATTGLGTMRYVTEFRYLLIGGLTSFSPNSPTPACRRRCWSWVSTGLTVLCLLSHVYNFRFKFRWKVSYELIVLQLTQLAGSKLAVSSLWNVQCAWCAAGLCKIRRNSVTCWRTSFNHSQRPSTILRAEGIRHDSSCRGMHNSLFSVVLTALFLSWYLNR